MFNLVPSAPYHGVPTTLNKDDVVIHL